MSDLSEVARAKRAVVVLMEVFKAADMLRGYHAGMSGQPFIETETEHWQEGWHIAQQHAAMEA